MAPIEVLVAGEDSSQRNAIVDALRKDGFRVRDATSGTAVLEIFARADVDPALVPDVLVASSRLRGTSGVKLLREILRRNLATRVILVVPPEDAEISEDARRLGAAEILEEPIDVGRIRRAVARLAREA